MSKTDIPNKCPHCHVVILPKELSQYRTGNLSNDLFIIWQCVNHQCQKNFITIHEYDIENEHYVFISFLNGSPFLPAWDKNINELKDANTGKKSRFFKIYIDSLISENRGLLEIYGIGYRKALEFLVKDWAIHTNPDEKAKIEKQTLGQVIDNYLNGVPKELAKRANWLGTDETHYIKKRTEHDVQDMKALIDLLVARITTQIKEEKFINDIKPVK